MLRRVAVFLCALSMAGCGGIFLPPPPPSSNVCVQHLDGTWVNCDCYALKGAFTWKHWAFRACAKPAPEASFRIVLRSHPEFVFDGADFVREGTKAHPAALYASREEARIAAEDLMLQGLDVEVR